LLGVDGSPGSEAVVKAVARRAWPSSTQVRLVTSLGLLVTPYVGTDPAGAMLPVVTEQQRVAMCESATKVQDQAMAQLTTVGLRVSRVVKEGDPKRTLLNEAVEWGADAVFVGSSGLGRLERLLLGSVASAVVTRAPCSVEVVRALV
jgi:nucleotide-binding universal stress UspA family protein